MQPPQPPYEGFPNPNDPLPPRSELNPNQFNPNPGPQISFDSISQAWTVLQSSLGTYIGATFVASLALIIGQMIFFGSIARAPKGPTGEPLIGGAVYLMLMLGSLISGLMFTGILQMAIQHLKTGHADFVQVFSVFGVLPNLILAGILVFVAVYIGACFCIIPGFLLSGLFMFVGPLIIDRRMGAIEAMKTSFNALKPQMWMALLYTIVISLVAQVGFLACVVGGLVTAPLAMISMAITYRNFFPDGSSGFNFQNPNTPVAPIADPRF